MAMPVFSEVHSEALRRLAREAMERKVHEGDTLAPKGPPGALVVILEGTAVLRARNDSFAILPLGVGDFVGELGALYGRASIAEAVALGDLTSAVFAPSLVRAMVRAHEGVRRALEEVAWERGFAALARGARFLRRFPEEARARVYARFEPVQVEEGTPLLTEGRDPEALWLLAAGEVEIYGGGLEGAWMAETGDAIGVSPFLDSTPSGVSARAATDALAARLPAAAFRALLTEFPGLSAARDDVGVEGSGVYC